MKNALTHLDNLSERLVYILGLTKTKKADLARAINVKPQVIQFLCNGSTQSSRFTFEIAVALGLNTRWLATGKGAIFIADDPKKKILLEYQLVPLFNITETLKLADGLKLEAIEADAWLPYKTKKETFFAMLMPDESMQPTIPHRALIFIERLEDGAIPVENDIVLIFLRQFNAMIVRKYSIHNGSAILVSTNNEIYTTTPFSKDMKIIGLVTNCSFSLKNPEV
jgi:hypothetical protein